MHLSRHCHRPMLRRAVVVAVLAFGVLAIGGPASATLESQQATVKLRIGVPTTIVTGAPYLTDKWGYFKREGIEPEFIVATTGQLLTQAMLAGDVDVAVSSFRIPMELQEQGQELRLLSNVCKFQSLALMVPKNSGIRALRDVKGTRVGVAGLGSAQHTTMQTLLIKAGMSANDVTYVPVGTGSSAVAAFRRGLIDALLTSDPAIQILNLSGEGRIVLDLRKGQGGALAQAPSVGSFTTVKFIQSNEAVLHGFVRALSRTLKRIVANPTEAAKTFSALPQYKTAGGSRVIRNAVIGDVPCFTPYITREQILITSSVFQEVGVLKKSHTWESTVAGQFARDWNAKP